jgi:hypothetical protein
VTYVYLDNLVINADKYRIDCKIHNRPGVNNGNTADMVVVYNISNLTMVLVQSNLARIMCLKVNIKRGIK